VRDPHETLTFDLSDEDLAFAVEHLEGPLAKAINKAAWHRLRDELARRKEPGRPMSFPIDMAACVFENLPVPVKDRMRPKLVPPSEHPRH
jgi:hypothetical protein